MAAFFFFCALFASLLIQIIGGVSKLVENRKETSDNRLVWSAGFTDALSLAGLLSFQRQRAQIWDVVCALLFHFAHVDTQKSDTLAVIEFSTLLLRTSQELSKALYCIVVFVFVLFLFFFYQKEKCRIEKFWLCLWNLCLTHKSNTRHKKVYCNCIWIIACVQSHFVWVAAAL